MVTLNNILKVIFVFVGVVFVLSLVSLPKTDCEACHFELLGYEYNGYEAYDVFEAGCISYSKPWDNDYIYIDIDKINATTIGDGLYVINFSEASIK